MTVSIAFCNDCDFLTRKNFDVIHSFMKTLNIPVGDSFWLFDPSGGDMGLFTYDLSHAGPQHNWLLDKINDGTLDVLHSAGSYGERFNKGFSPNRQLIAGALEYLKKHAMVPKIWTNHGDQCNIQNIGGTTPAMYHGGDDPASESYCLDLLLEYGIKYFWLDSHVWRAPTKPYRIVSTEECRSGHMIHTFMRFLSPNVAWSPNGQNFELQLSDDDLAKFVKMKQDVVYYTHWGCHHSETYAHAPGDGPLTPNSKLALENFADTAERLSIKFSRLEPLLENNLNIEPATSLQRIGECLTKKEKYKDDNFYYNQFHKYGFPYFEKRLNSLDISGKRALDAGCGIGQWTFALTNHYEKIDGIDANPCAIEIANDIAAGTRFVSCPKFTVGSLEALPFDQNTFDFIFCNGVIFCTDISKTLKEFSRVLIPDGKMYINLNADGWYEYLCDSRFENREINSILQFAEPIFNAIVNRIGTLQLYIEYFRELPEAKLQNILSDDRQYRNYLSSIMNNACPDELKKMIDEYSGRVIECLMRLTIYHLSKNRNADSISASNALKAFVCRFLKKDKEEIQDIARYELRNVALMPLELAQLVDKYGFTLLAHAPDAGLCKQGDIIPIYQPTFNSHTSVWECILQKKN
ncbi:class I SAM-dependent methyltransferase [Desulfovibrio sp. OttesenSCG-928-G11]|nr:class I SAM-dependent methyltransferase [Desulfovibrio sp. OttesenSCG-928-G11]